jgi:hypothetical protein
VGLPPQGPLQRPAPNVGDKVFALRGNLLNAWKSGEAVQIIDKVSLS